LEKRYSTVFYRLCEDLIANAEKISIERVISHSIRRWNIWRALFNNKHNKLMGSELIKGLIGELLFLKNFMFDEYGTSESIEAWTGPLGNPKDYLINDTWYEVKTVNESKQSIRISSLEQLDSELLGYLVVIKLESTSNQVNNHINLNSLIGYIAGFIEDAEDLEKFIRKLNNLGYQFDIEYNEYCYVYKRTVFYKVDLEFPVIKRKSLSNSIIRVSYELALVDIQAERTEKWK
jgi:hypothetical protein